MRQLTVTLRHPRTDELESKTFEVSERTLNLALLEDYAEWMAKFAKQACRDIASRHFDLEDFSGDSAYLDALEGLTDTYKIESVRLEGETRRYLVDTQYPDHLDNQPYSTYVEATDEMEAQFLAAWKQGVAEGGGGESTDNHEEFQSLVEYIAEVNIVGVMVASIHDEMPLGEIVDRGRALLKAVETGEGLDEAMQKAKEVQEIFSLLQAMNQLVEAVENDEHVETVAEFTRNTFVEMKLIEPEAPAAAPKI